MAAVFTNLHEYTSYNYDPTKTWGLRGSLAVAMPALNTGVAERVKKLNATADDSLSGAIESAITTFGANFTKSLLSKGAGEAVTSSILVGNGYSVLGAVGPLV